MAADYYQNYYDKRNGGAYFVGPKDVADIYGEKKDLSRIVYAAMPDVDTQNETSQQEYLYPLCYIPRSRVKYTTNASRGLGWRIHGSVEDTKLSTNKQHSLSPD